MQQYALPAAKVVLVAAYVWLVYNFIPVGFVFALFSLAFAVLYTVVLDQLIKRLPVAKFKPSVPLHEWPKSCALVRSHLPFSCILAICDFDLLDHTAIYIIHAGLVGHGSIWWPGVRVRQAAGSRRSRLGARSAQCRQAR